jgi:hypothetical protein
MSKLEDKLTASIKKPEQAKKTDKAKASENTADAKPKQTSTAPAKSKQAKQAIKRQQASSATNQSVLHPQRIWPD